MPVPSSDPSNFHASGGKYTPLSTYAFNFDRENSTEPRGRGYPQAFQRTIIGCSPFITKLTLSPSVVVWSDSVSATAEYSNAGSGSLVLDPASYSWWRFIQSHDLKLPIEPEMELASTVFLDEL